MDTTTKWQASSIVGTDHVAVYTPDAGLGNWHHLACTFSADGNIGLYYDGVQLSYGGGVNQMMAPYFAAVGLPTTNEGQVLGAAAYARYWNAELTTSEIAAEMNSATAVRTANLYADWNLTSDLTDSSGHGHTMTPAGTAVFVDNPDIDDGGSTGGGGSGDWTIVTHFAQGSPDKQGFTSDAYDTTGANLLILAGCSISSFDVSDNKGNTWLLAAENGSSYYKRTFYAANPIVGAGHTFSMTGIDDSPSMAVLAVKDAALTSPLDQSNNNGGYSASTSPGPVTPTEDGELIVTSTLCDGEEGDFSIDEGFVIVEGMPATFGAHWGIGLAYLGQGTAATVEPTWSVTPSNLVGSTIVSFKSGVAVGPTPTYKDLTGSASGVAVTTATPTRKRRLTAASAGVAVDVGVATRKKRIAANASAGKGTTNTATIQRERPVVGTSAGVTSVSATLRRRVALVATSAGVTSVSVALTRKKSLTVSVVGVATAVGTITKLSSTVFAGAVASATGQSSVGVMRTTVGLMAQRMQSTASASVPNMQGGAIMVGQPATGSASSQISVMRTSNGIAAGVASSTSTAFGATILSGVRLTANLMTASGQMQSLTVALSGLFLAQALQMLADSKTADLQISNKLLAQIAFVNAFVYAAGYKTEARWFAQTAIVN